MPRPARPLVRFIILAELSVVLGLASAIAAVGIASRRGRLTIGPWTTSTTAGSASAGFYERAATAVHAPFALNRSETIYYRAHTDDAGRPLDGRCTYSIAGRPLPARWWSLTAYAGDDYLIPNAAGRYSFNMRNVAYEADGSFVVRASQTAQERNWLPLSGGHVSFVLRLYNSDAAISQDPTAVKLPRIQAECPP